MPSPHCRRKRIPLVFKKVPRAKTSMPFQFPIIGVILEPRGVEYGLPYFFFDKYGTYVLLNAGLNFLFPFIDAVSISFCF